MATTYKQTWTKYDGKLGAVTFEFVISDDYYDLFDQAATTATGIFDIGTTKEDLDIDVYIQAIDELSFSINPERIISATDSTVLAFTLAGLEQATPRYIALFINPATPGAVASKVFDGQINNDARGTDVKWNDAQWLTTQNPDRIWEFTGVVFPVAALNTQDVFRLMFLLSKETAWIATNVFKDSTAKSCFSYTGIFGGFFSNMDLKLQNQVNLANLLSKIIDIALTDPTFGIRQSFPGYTINIINSDSSIYFTPGNPNLAINPSNGLIDVTGFVPEIQQPIQLRVLGSGGNECIINYDMAIVVTDNNSNKEHSFQRFDNLTDLLIQTALSFGCYLKFETIAKDEINISFVPRQNLSATQTYIIDAESAILNIEYAENNDENLKYYGLSNNFATEGNDTATYNTNSPSENDGTMTSSKQMAAFEKTGEKLLFTVSPTTYLAKPVNEPFGIVPWNGFFFNRTNSNIDKIYRYFGITTGIYQKSINNSAYTVPSVQASFEVDGVQRAFSTLAECVNALIASDGVFYSKEYELKVPYILGFSLNANGSSNDWDQVNLGNKIVVDSIDYVVIGIERNYNDLTTSIRLHKTSQYAMPQPDSSLMTLSLETLSGGFDNLLFATNSFLGTSGESLDVGVAVYLGSPDQKWHYGYSETINGGLIGGVTLNSANINQSIQIFGGGILGVDGLQGFDAWDWQPGLNEGLYVRAKKGFEPSGTNISQTELDAKDGTEDFYIKIGFPIEPKKAVLDFSKQFIFED